MKQFGQAVLCGLVLTSVNLAAAVDADAESKISGSKVSMLRYAVRSGEEFSIINSDVCLGAGEPCEIVVEKGGSLDLTNANLGSRLTIYRQDPVASAVNIVNTDITGEMHNGLPSDYGVSPAGTETSPGQKLSNTNSANYSTTVRPHERFELINSNLCLDNRGNTCPINTAKGSELHFSNTNLGRRVVISSSQSHLTALNWVNVEFAGSLLTGGSVIKAEVPTPAPVDTTRNEDAAIVSELAKRSIKAASTPRGVVIALPDVFFEFDKSNLTDEARANVDTIAEILQGHAARQIAVEGHTDAIGSVGYNQTLSEQRARSVAQALSAQGISSSRLSAEGYGKSRPVADNETEEGRARNRRVEVILEKSTAKSITDSLNRHSRVKGGNQTVEVDSSDGNKVELTEDSLKVKNGDTEVYIGNDGLRVRSN